jgi:hypothetical protein
MLLRKSCSNRPFAGFRSPETGAEPNQPKTARHGAVRLFDFALAKEVDGSNLAHSLALAHNQNAGAWHESNRRGEWKDQ